MIKEGRKNGFRWTLNIKQIPATKIKPIFFFFSVPTRPRISRRARRPFKGLVAQGGSYGGDEGGGRGEKKKKKWKMKGTEGRKILKNSFWFYLLHKLQY